MPRTLSQRIPFVFESLQKLGAVVKPGTRLDLLARVYRADDGSFTRDVPFAEGEPFKFALESFREFDLFEFILDPWEFGTEPLPLEKLRVAVLNDHPLQHAQATGNTIGRDTLLELFVATAFRRSSAGGDMLSASNRKTPDVQTRACGRFFYVEVKRVKSRARVVPAIADAAKQLDATGCPGAAFLDVTMAFNEKNLSMAKKRQSTAQTYDAFGRWVEEQFEPLRTEVDKVIRGSRLTSVFLKSYMPISVDGYMELLSLILSYPQRVTGRYAREGEEIRRSIDFVWRKWRPLGLQRH